MVESRYGNDLMASYRCFMAFDRVMNIETRNL